MWDQMGRLLNDLELLECKEKCSGEAGFKQYWNLFFGPPPFRRKLIHVCEVDSFLDRNIDAILLLRLLIDMLNRHVGAI